MGPCEKWKHRTHCSKVCSADTQQGGPPWVDGISGPDDWLHRSRPTRGAWLSRWKRGELGWWGARDISPRSISYFSFYQRMAPLLGTLITQICHFINTFLASVFCFIQVKSSCHTHSHCVPRERERKTTCSVLPFHGKGITNPIQPRLHFEDFWTGPCLVLIFPHMENLCDLCSTPFLESSVHIPCPRR